MAITWMLSEIRTKVRDLTGKQSTAQLGNSALDDRINDFYENRFPLEVDSDHLKSSVTQAASATDSGEYSISHDVLKLITDDEEFPITINGQRIKVYHNRKWFFNTYPPDGGAAYCITAPSLAIGSSSAAAVANNAFSYRIEQYSYSKAAAETALSGDTVPQNKYGAWRLEINTSGTISIVEAGDNATGYDTPGKALEGLAVESGTKAAMGYVTAINTASGGFVPGTTLLNASTVTDTYTDGFNSTRDRPGAMLYDRGTLYLRPKPDDIYQFEAPTIAKPDALSADSSTPTVVGWGPVIAYGTAIEIALDDKDMQLVQELQSPYDYYKNLVSGKELLQMSDRRAPSTF